MVVPAALFLVIEQFNKESSLPTCMRCQRTIGQKFYILGEDSDSCFFLEKTVRDAYHFDLRLSSVRPKRMCVCSLKSYSPPCGSSTVHYGMHQLSTHLTNITSSTLSHTSSSAFNRLVRLPLLPYYGVVDSSLSLNAFTLPPY